MSALRPLPAPPPVRGFTLDQTLRMRRMQTGTSLQMTLLRGFALDRLLRYGALRRVR